MQAAVIQNTDSAGMLMYQLLTGAFPFWDNVQHASLQQVWQAILVKNIDLSAPHLKEMMSDGARDLLKGLLRRDPAQRMTALIALDHPWVKEGGLARDLPLGGSVVRKATPLMLASLPKEGSSWSCVESLSACRFRGCSGMQHMAI